MSRLLAEKLIRDIPDFPKPGIIFKDITPVLQSPGAFQEVIDQFAEFASERQPDVIVGIESRGFVFGAPVALALSRPFIPVRKVGKLPAETIREEYALEYGVNAVEIHTDSILKGQRALVIDDLLATGGTARATAALIERLGGRVVGYSFLIELSFLHGRDKLSGYDVQALIAC
ncbi:MAG: adenine phosphoribosyltransferase [Capsulimonadaceae bacterium]|nr:adenine phosphoribosyltransferase [Capsulimonadaceae bacterium]